MKKTKFQPWKAILIVALWLTTVFTYHWGMTTVDDAKRFVQTFVTHEFVLDNIIDVHDSTGIMVKWDDKEKVGYILTCSHVVRHHAEVPISWLDENGELYEEICPVVVKDEANDLAIIRTKKQFKTFTIMSDKEYYKRVKDGMTVWAAGHPTDLEGQMLTIGQIISRDFSYVCQICPAHETVKGILHDATIWYGFSGGPLVDPDTCKVVGLNYKLTPQVRSRWGMTIPAPVINEFLKKNLK